MLNELYVTYFRSRYKKTEQEDIDHQTCYTENFWKYCESTLEPQGDDIKPGFSKDTCFKYSKKKKPFEIITT